MALSARFEEAFVYAAQLHATQVRKGSQVPYIAHLMAVASLALEHGADEDEAIAALLHDAVEDQGGPPTLAAIRQRFGDRVAEIVSGCTDADSHPKPPWRERKETFIRHLPLASRSIRLVAACDKLHNARAILLDYRVIGEAVWNRFAGKKEGTLWYYRTLLDVFKADARDGLIPAPLIDELERVVVALEALSAQPAGR
jgi:(p)ppGpp synthase/HD superfamily hydrolase